MDSQYLTTGQAARHCRVSIPTVRRWIHIKAHSDTRTIRILGLTGYPDTIPAFLDAGADACLAKPVDLQAVQRELNRVLPLVGPS